MDAEWQIRLCGNTHSRKSRARKFAFEARTREKPHLQRGTRAAVEDPIVECRCFNGAPRVGESHNDAPLGEPQI
jgi:hypothetical protein